VDTAAVCSEWKDHATEHRSLLVLQCLGLRWHIPAVLYRVLESVETATGCHLYAGLAVYTFWSG